MATRRSPVEAVLTGLVTTLKATTGVTGLATGGVFNNVPQGTAFPYLEVTSPTDRKADTLGRLGATVLVDVKAVSQAKSDQEAARIIDQVVRALNFQKPAISGHRIVALDLDGCERFAELINSVPTRYHVATFRVWTEQSTS